MRAFLKASAALVVYSLWRWERSSACRAYRRCYALFFDERKASFAEAFFQGALAAKEAHWRKDYVKEGLEHM